MQKRTVVWIWLALSVTLFTVLLLWLFQPSSALAPLMTPGSMSHGHKHMERSCQSCHERPFGGSDAIEKKCLLCHQSELKEFEDKHGFAKFRDPRNADRLKEINALKCISCHKEHQGELKDEMGASLSADFCLSCHKDIAKERPSHKAFEFQSCATTGCHNYHDNQALYEDFLLKHQNESATKTVIPLRSIKSYLSSMKKAPLAIAQSDLKESPSFLQQWIESSHAKAGVNCKNCHQDGKALKNVSKSPSCIQCHKHEAQGFLASKHGIREAAKLSPLKPEMARLAMHKEALHRELSCVSCHKSHSFQTQEASIDACLACHDDTHSKNYKASKHAGLKNVVSCATCHMPKTLIEGEGTSFTQHNPNLNLRPNEKMIRSVCLSCHGLGFSIDALADRALIGINFAGRPSKHIPSIDMAIKHQESKGKK